MPISTAILRHKLTTSRNELWEMKLIFRSLTHQFFFHIIPTNDETPTYGNVAFISLNIEISGLFIIDVFQCLFLQERIMIKSPGPQLVTSSFIYKITIANKKRNNNLQITVFK